MHAIVKEHLEYFKSCYSKSSVQTSGITGFGNCSARTAFDEVLNQSNDYFIPACLLFIYFGKGGISKNKGFALKTLKSMHLNSSGINDNIVAYVYAYCLQKEGQTKESHAILKLLKEEQFAPAFMTYGDFLIKKGDFDSGLVEYRKAIRPVSYTHLRAHETGRNLVCRLLLEKKK